MKFLALRRSLPRKRYAKLFRPFSTVNIHTEERPCEKNDRLEGAYDPNNVETEDKYLGWCEKERYFVKTLEKHCKGLVLPPPNITGKLHLGHALSGTIQDVIARIWRMRGNQITWIPGTDHAGIATQTRVEQFLRGKGLHRTDMDRNHFNSHVLQWKNQYQTNITSQLKRMGFSLDWKREVFTLDPIQSEAVIEAFVRLFDEGLIYRSDHLVNWSCFLRSTISDMEVDNIEISGVTDVSVPGYDSSVKFGQMVYFAYKVSGSADEIIVATTRPETILGDIAIAVNTNDNRYSRYIGQFVDHPFFEKQIPVVADESVDVDFGTGAVKITPAHDKYDYSVAIKHNLPIATVINEYGCMINSGKFDGMKRYDARTAIINELSNKGILRNIAEHKMFLPICSRSKDVIELLPKPQWYLDCGKLGKQAMEAVENQSLELIPNFHEKSWNDWISEERNWCLSRQLWWGHRIPAFKVYETQNPDINVWVAARSEEEAYNKVLKLNRFDKNAQLTFEQDSDVLDTWFSSGIYPFSIVGWPNISNDYKKLYPYELLVTGHDILRFWVYRMVILGLKLTDTLPFNKVLLHGIICDSKGAKMSKSKGNIIDPEDIINGISLENLQEKTIDMYNQKLLSTEEMNIALKSQKKMFSNGIPKCGADALRFTLCSKNITSHYIHFNIQDCVVNQHFGNKIWQSLKYYQNLYDVCSSQQNVNKFTLDCLKPIDLWILSRLLHLVKSVNSSFDSYDFHIATSALKNFLYYELCDVYVECTKYYLNSDLNVTENIDGLLAHCHTFSVCYNMALRCLAPFMPFITEELIPKIPLSKNMIFQFLDSIDDLKLPHEDSILEYHNPELEKQVTIMSDILSTVRHLKNVYEIKNNLDGFSIEHADENIHNVLKNFGHILKFMTKINKDIQIQDQFTTNESIIGVTEFNGYRINLDLPEIYNVTDILRIGRAKLKKRKDKLQLEYEKLHKRIHTPGYEEKTPEETKLLISSKFKSTFEELETIKRFSSL